MVSMGRRVGPWGISKALVAIVASMMLFSALQLATPLAGHVKGTDGTRSGPSAESRYKEYPNSDSWSWLNPITSNNKFSDVMWQPNSNKAVMVGLSGLIIERQGNYWATVQSNTIYNLWHVEWRPSGDYALIVGNFGTVLRYEPGAATHLKPGTSTRLQGVAWMSDGSYGLICGWDGLILKYDGSTFARIDSGTHKRLYNVSYSDTGGWLISGEDGLLLSFDETTGKVTTIASGVKDMLYSVDWFNGVALIVGGNGTILKYQNSVVTKVSNSITHNDLFGVEWDRVNNYAMIVGVDGVALKYLSTGSLTDISPPTSEALTGVSFLNHGSDAMVVGTNGIVYYFVNGGGWTLLSSIPFQADWKDVAWAPNGSMALIVGSNGNVLRYTTKAGLSSIKTGVTTTLRAVGWAPNSSYAIIVGDDGTVLKFQGSSIVSLPAGVSGINLLSIDWRSDGQYALIVGTLGKVLKFDGTNFYTVVPEGQPQFYLFSVAFHPGNDYALIVGASGTSFKCDEDPAPKYLPAGLKCLRIVTGVFTALMDIRFRPDGDYGMVAGMGGVVLKYKADAFEQVDTEVNDTTLIVIAWKTNSIYPVIAGADGYFLKYSGYGMVQMPCPTISPINGISWNGTSALVVGDKSQILLYNSPPLNNPYASIKSPGEGQEFTVADNIPFSAFDSLAPDDASIQFYWISNISGPLGPAPSFVSKLPAGQHRITLLVNASGGRSDADAVDIMVKTNAKPPHPVISSPVDGRTYNTTDSIYFDASKSTDPNGYALSYHWVSDIDGPIADGTGFSKFLTKGLHKIALYASNGYFNRSTSVNITVKPPNFPPTVAILSPKATDIIRAGDQIQFNATAFDKEGDTMRCSWFSNRTGFLDSHKFFIGTLEVGKHRIEFHAEDQYKHNSSAVVNVTVLPKLILNKPPTITITWPDDGQNIAGTVNVTGTASDPDGVVVAVEYEIGNDNWRTATGNNTWSFLWVTTDFTNGAHNFSVSAYDGKNKTNITRTVIIENKWKDVHAKMMYPVNNLPPLSGDVKVWGNANQDRTAQGHYIARVEIKVDDGTWQIAEQTESWRWTFKTTNYKNGDHTLSVRAIDEEGTASPIEKVTVKVHNEPPGVFGTNLSMAQFAAIVLIVLLVIIVIIWVLMREPSKPEKKTGRKGRPVRPIDEEAEDALDKEMAKDDEEKEVKSEEE